MDLDGTSVGPILRSLKQLRIQKIYRERSDWTIPRAD